MPWRGAALSLDRARRQVYRSSPSHPCSDVLLRHLSEVLPPDGTTPGPAPSTTRVTSRFGGVPGRRAGRRAGKSVLTHLISSCLSKGTLSRYFTKGHHQGSLSGKTARKMGRRSGSPGRRDRGRVSSMFVEGPRGRGPSTYTRGGVGGRRKGRPLPRARHDSHRAASSTISSPSPNLIGRSPPAGRPRIAFGEGGRYLLLAETGTFRSPSPAIAPEARDDGGHRRWAFRARPSALLPVQN